MGLRFSNLVEAWNDIDLLVAFAGEDAGTSAPIVCAIMRDALVTHFGAHVMSVPSIIQSFRANRDLIERVASEKYVKSGRVGPIILRRHDFAGRIPPPPLH